MNEATVRELITELDRQYGASPYYVIGQVEALACGRGFGTPRQRLARIKQVLAVWDKTHQEHDCS